MNDETRMNCEQVADRLTDLMEGDLPEQEQEAALSHLATCDRCEAVLADTQSASDLAREHGRVELNDADRERMLGVLLHQVDHNR